MQFQADAAARQQQRAAAVAQKTSAPQPISSATVPDDTAMVNIPIPQTIAHLAHVCQAAAPKTPGCQVTRTIVHAGFTKPIREAVDRGHFIVRRDGAQYLDMVIDTSRVYAMFNTRTNFIMVTTKFAQAFGYKVPPFNGIFTLANGQRETYAGKLGRNKLQLYNKLLVEVDGIRVLEGPIIGATIGSNLLGASGAKLRAFGAVQDSGVTMLNIKMVEKHSGVLFQVRLAVMPGVVDRQTAPTEEHQDGRHS